MKLFELHKQDFDFEKFKEECAPYLKLLFQTFPQLPMHGSDAAPSEYEIWDFKNRTRPRDTPSDVHKMANDIFEEKFGHRFRDWMFLTSSTRDARAYGRLNLIFPIGDFHYAWSPMIEDLTTARSEFRDLRRKELRLENPNISYDEITNIADKEFAEKLKDTKYYLDQEFEEAVDSKHEIMLSCTRFYIMGWTSDVYQDIVRHYLRENAQ